MNLKRRSFNFFSYEQSFSKDQWWGFMSAQITQTLCSVVIKVQHVNWWSSALTPAQNVSPLCLRLRSCTAVAFTTSPAGSAAPIFQPAGFLPAAALASPTAARPTWGTRAWLLAKSTSRLEKSLATSWVGGERVWNRVKKQNKKNTFGWMSVAVVSAGMLRAGDVLHRGKYGDYRWSYLWHRLLSGTTRDPHFPNS